MSVQYRLAEVFIGTSVLCWLLMTALIVTFVRLRIARRHYAELQESFAQGARGFRIQTAKLTEANGVIHSLQTTVADTSRLLTDAQGTVTLLEQRLADADLSRDVALAGFRTAQERIREIEMHAIDMETQLAAAHASVADLETRLRLPDPTPADLVLLDAAARPERLQDGPVAVPEGCRVETVLHRPQTVVRGPGGKFVRLAGQVEPSNDFVVGRDRKDGWA